jgi:hypothetical protein
MGAQASTNTSTVSTDIVSEAYNKCPSVTASNTLILSGVQHRPDLNPKCDENSESIIDQKAAIDANCLLSSLQDTLASTVSTMDATAQGGLGIQASTNVSDIKTSLTTKAESDCADLSTTNLADIKDTMITSCKWHVVQDASVKTSCVINNLQKMANQVEATESATAQGATLGSFLFGYSSGSAIGMIILLLVIVGGGFAYYYYVYRKKDNAEECDGELDEDGNCIPTNPEEGTDETNPISGDEGGDDSGNDNGGNTIESTNTYVQSNVPQQPVSAPKQTYSKQTYTQTTQQALPANYVPGRAYAGQVLSPPPPAYSTGGSALFGKNFLKAISDPQSFIVGLKKNKSFSIIIILLLIVMAVFITYSNKKNNSVRSNSNMNDMSTLQKKIADANAIMNYQENIKREKPNKSIKTLQITRPDLTSNLVTGSRNLLPCNYDVVGNLDSRARYETDLNDYYRLSANY